MALGSVLIGLGPRYWKEPSHGTDVPGSNTVRMRFDFFDVAAADDSRPNHESLWEEV